MSKLRASDQPRSDRGKGDGRLRLDLRDRLRDHRGRDPHVVRVEAALIVGCLVLYAMGHVADRQGMLPPLLRRHGFDVLAMPTLIGVANVLTAVSPFRAVPFRRAAPAIALTLLGAGLWEGLAPLYTASTGDWRDVIAYFAGTALYLLVVRAGRSIRRSTSE